MDDEQKIKTFLSDSYKKTHWPFVLLRDLKRYVGSYPKDTLNNMVSRGLIRRNEGINDILIEITKKGIETLCVN